MIDITTELSMLKIEIRAQLGQSEVLRITGKGTMTDIPKGIRWI